MSRMTAWSATTSSWPTTRRLAAMSSIGDYAFLGGLSAVHQFVRIGAHAMIGGLTGVERDVIPYGIGHGRPRAARRPQYRRTAAPRLLARGYPGAAHRLSDAVRRTEGTLADARSNEVAAQLSADMRPVQDDRRFHPRRFTPRGLVPAEVGEWQPKLGIVAGARRAAAAPRSRRAAPPAVRSSSSRFEGFRRSRPARRTAAWLDPARRGRRRPAPAARERCRGAGAGGRACAARRCCQLRPDWRTAQVLRARSASARSAMTGCSRAVVSELEERGLPRRRRRRAARPALAPAAARSAVSRPTSRRRGHRARFRASCARPGRARYRPGGRSCSRAWCWASRPLEGTDALIARCRRWRREGPGGVLVKLAKPGQERRADLPTIGPRTVAQAAAAGLARHRRRSRRGPGPRPRRDGRRRRPRRPLPGRHRARRERRRRRSST